MTESSLFFKTRNFLSSSYDEKLCKEIIRNSSLGLRKSPKKFQSIRMSTNSRKKYDDNENGCCSESSSENVSPEKLKISRKRKQICVSNELNVSGNLENLKISDDLSVVPNSKVLVKCLSSSNTNEKGVNYEKVDSKKTSQTSFISKETSLFNVGSLVWSALASWESWPAMIIDPSMSGHKCTTSDKCWVFWFGDHKLSEVSKNKVSDFQLHFHHHYNSKNNKKKYVKGIFEALQLCRDRLNASVDCDGASLLKWSALGFKSSTDQLKNDDYCIPEWINLILQKYAREMEKKNISDEDGSCHEEKGIVTHTRAQNDISHFEEICLACKSCDGFSEHPFFYGKFCSTCKERFLTSLFLFDEDGFNMFCIICAQPGEMFLCDEVGCNKVYCHSCLVYFCGKSETTQLRQLSRWTCFLCSLPEEKSNKLLRGREDWRCYLALSFQPDSVVIPLKKHALRVLSLFDGISTGKLILNELKLKVEIYYASEIDPDSLLVSKMRHSGGTIQWIGDVTSLFCDKLKEFGPIDLLIGGSPCNDFSFANPYRKGLEHDGTGILFYEFYRVLACLREIQTPDRPLFWIFENVASMQKHCKSTISRFFNCHPVLLDAKYFSAQKRARLFWGNIPGMHCPPQYDKMLHPEKLKDNLFPERRSQVDKIRTVTTNPNSLLQKGGNEMPVLMYDNEETSLWLPELERIFGFPDHYTDVGDLPRTKRQKLIGQAWSVHVVKHLLAPLKNYFQHLEENE